MSSTVEQIKSRLSISDLVGSYLKIEKAGANYKARCPFHHEKTPSFFVSPARESYHCFGCGKGGDIFSFLQEIEGVDFRGALSVLAERTGVVIESEFSSSRTEEDTLRAILSEAVLYYEKCLAESHIALQYLENRGISRDSIKSFHIGFAKDEWRGLEQHLLGKKFLHRDIEKAGLIIASAKGYYDRYRGRVMFPIYDMLSRPIGFSGRILASDPNISKYINCPETPLYQKSKVLYGIERAKQEIRKKDLCILVEGQMDVVMSHQSGVQNVVACSGTALTPEHIKLVRRLSNNLALSFDADKAGLTAAERSIKLALEEGCEVRVISLPAGLDPADLAKSDPEDLKKRLENPRHVIDFFIEQIQNENLGERERRLAGERRILPYLALLSSKIDQAHFVARVAQFLGLKDEIIWKSVAEISRKQRTPATENKANVRTDEKHNQSALDVPQRIDRIERQLWGLMYWLPDASSLIRKLQEMLGDDEYQEREGRMKLIREELLWEAEHTYKGSGSLDEEIDLLCKNFKNDLLKARLHNIIGKLHTAEKSGDEHEVAQLLRECQEITHLLRLKQV